MKIGKHQRVATEHDSCLITEYIGYDVATAVSKWCPSAFIDPVTNRLMVATPDGHKAVTRGCLIIALDKDLHKFDVLEPNEHQPFYREV